MSNTKQTAPLIVNRFTAMQAGFEKDLTAKQSLSVLGTLMTQTAILAALASDLGLVTDVESARNALAAKIAAKKAGMPKALAFLKALEEVLKQFFGPLDPRLQDFGIKPPKPRKHLTAEQKTLAVAAQKTTKKARGIMGKKQRASITTTGKPGLALVTPEGEVVTGLLTGPTSPGSGTPVAPGTAPAAATAPASPAVAQDGGSESPAATPDAGGGTAPANSK